MEVGRHSPPSDNKTSHQVARKPTKRQSNPSERTNWSPSVAQWLESYDINRPASDDEMALRRRLARNPRFRELSTSLMSFAERPGREASVIDFLEAAFELPKAWDFWKNQTGDPIDEAAKPIQQAAQSFLGALNRHRGLVTWYLSASNEERPDARFQCLVSTVAAIRDAAKAGHRPIHREDMPKISRMRGVKNAKAIFYVRALTKQAKDLFGDPLYKEVGELAALCLGLPEPITARQVTEYTRTRRRKAGIREKR